MARRSVKLLRCRNMMESSTKRTNPTRRARWHVLRRTASRMSHYTLIGLLVFLATILSLATPVEAQPSITSFPTPLPQGKVGTPYSAALTVTGGTPPYSWGTPVGVPSGLSFTAAGNTGILSGTPATAGTFPFGITVTDNTTASASFANPITISPASTGLTFLTTSLPEATEGSPYTASLSVSGGTSPYAWAVVGGTLPAGLVLQATNGYISGTPRQGTAGTHSFTIGVTDSSSPTLSAQRSFSLVVERLSYQLIVTIGSGLSAGETTVYVGRIPVATLRGGESIRLDFDPYTSHSISVDSIVEHPTEAGVRFKAEVDRITVSELSPTAHFPYYAEYLVELKAQPSAAARLTGSGWYEKGHRLRVSAPTQVEGEPGTQYRFSHWWLPTGETDSDANLSLIVSQPGSCIAKYDTYYLLTCTSPHGHTEGSHWYKAGSQAEWGVVTAEVPMSGILGVFGGKLKAVNYSGTAIMDGPKTITVDWEPDYTLPLILIPLALLLVTLASYGLYLLWRRPQLGPAPVPTLPPAPQPLPYPQTTVVMIGDRPQRSLQTTREQLIDQFSQLLQKYEEEIRASIGTEQAQALPGAKAGGKERLLPAPGMVQPTLAAAMGTPEETGTRCSFATKKLLRTVVSSWRQLETKTASPTPAGEKKAARGPHVTAVWARDIYQAWEILTCSLPEGHKGAHQGSFQVVHSLLNTVTEEKTYSPKQKPQPPKPHYTDGMPEADIAAEFVIPPDQLPPETVP